MKKILMLDFKYIKSNDGCWEWMANYTHEIHESGPEPIEMLGGGRISYDEALGRVNRSITFMNSQIHLLRDLNRDLKSAQMALKSQRSWNQLLRKQR